MTLDELNAEHGIEGVLRVTEGRGGLSLIEIENARASARVSPYAGQVLGFRPSGAGDDLLFVGERAYFEAGKAIKGGIPICWPWFGADPAGKGRPAHGFVRSLPWRLSGTEAVDPGTTRVTLEIEDDDTTRALWRHPFRLRLDITVGATLGVLLTTGSSGDTPFVLTQGLHAYFKTGDATRTRVLGLDGCRYIDKAAGANDAIGHQQGPVIFGAEVNRIYENVGPELTIEDPALGRRVRIRGRNSRTCVVWNPWVATARAMDDLDDEDYRRFVCVETVNTASEQVEVAPGTECSLGAEYALEPL